MFNMVIITISTTSVRSVFLAQGQSWNCPIIEFPQVQVHKPEWHRYTGYLHDHRKHNEVRIMSTFLVYHPGYKVYILVMCHGKILRWYSYLHTSGMNWSICMDSCSSWVEFYNSQAADGQKINKYWLWWHLAATYHRCMDRFSSTMEITRLKSTEVFFITVIRVFNTILDRERCVKWVK